MEDRASILLVNDGGHFDHFGCRFVSDVLHGAFSPVLSIPIGTKPTPSDFVGIDFVIVNGEGTLHHGRGAYLCQKYPVPAVLINTVWQDNPKVDLSHFAYVSCRESLSAEAMRNCGISPDVVPDVMFVHDVDPGSGGGLVVSDSVTIGENGVRPTMANLEKFLSADRIVAGRFHVACLAMMTGKPFSCYPSNTHKTKGMMKDAGHGFYETRREALKWAHRPTGYSYLAQSMVPKMLDKVLALSVVAKQET